MKQNIILGILVVIVGILIFGLFRKQPDSNLELIKAKDETIKAVTSERDVYRKWKDDEVREGQKKDSLLQLRYKTNTIRYEKIPVIISNLSDDELRSAVENYR